MNDGVHNAGVAQNAGAAHGPYPPRAKMTMKKNCAHNAGVSTFVHNAVVSAFYYFVIILQNECFQF